MLCLKLYLTRCRLRKKQGSLDGICAELRRIVDDRESQTVVSVSPAELDELDLKVRSLRTQLRKAEELSNQLVKQQKEIEDRIRRNNSDVNRLKTDLHSAEKENELAVKEGRKVVTQKTVVSPGKKKAAPWGGFVNVVRKSQSAAWEEKFKAMKQKQKQTSEPQPDWAKRAKKETGAIFTVKKSKSKEPVKKDNPEWMQAKLSRKPGSARTAPDKAEDKDKKKPGWTARTQLKKTEKKEETDADVPKRKDWRVDLKRHAN